MITLADAVIRVVLWLASSCVRYDDLFSRQLCTVRHREYGFTVWPSAKALDATRAAVTLTCQLL